ncbi:hypothetical protein ACHAP8_009788 [Fusarium lateritium]
MALNEQNELMTVEHERPTYVLHGFGLLSLQNLVLEAEEPWKGATCSDNEKHTGPFFYCMHCNETQCDVCWSGQRKHKKPDPGHNKTSLKDAIIVHSTLNVRLDEYGLLKDQIEQLRVPKQRRLDSGASEWFGVRPKNGDGGFLLTEGPAYDLMMEPVWTSASSIYPGLVSFIGETGVNNRGYTYVIIY